MALTYKGKATRRGDGKSVQVVVPAGQTIVAGQPVYIDGFHGIAVGAGEAGDIIAIETAPYDHEITIGAGVAAAKGATLYITTDGTHTVNATNTNRAAFKVVRAKNADNVVWVRILENR